MWKHDARRTECFHTISTPGERSVFTQFRVFPISTSADITKYKYGKNVLYIFYNTARRNIKKEIFRVDIELYQHVHGS
jgi:hypothetical protein